MKISELLNSDVKTGDHIYTLVTDSSMNHIVVGYLEIIIKNIDRTYRKNADGDFYCTSITLKTEAAVEIPKHINPCVDQYLNVSSGHHDVDEEMSVFLTEADAIKSVKHYQALRKKRKTVDKDYQERIAECEKLISSYEYQLESLRKDIKTLKSKQDKLLSSCSVAPLAFVIKE